jgi:hypothetical protein
MLETDRRTPVVASLLLFRPPTLGLLMLGSCCYKVLCFTQARWLGFSCYSLKKANVITSFLWSMSVNYWWWLLHRLCLAHTPFIGVGCLSTSCSSFLLLASSILYLLLRPSNLLLFHVFHVMWAPQTIPLNGLFYATFVVFLVLAVYYKIFLASFFIVVDLHPLSCRRASFADGSLGYDLLHNYSFFWYAIFFRQTHFSWYLSCIILMHCLPLMYNGRIVWKNLERVRSAFDVRFVHIVRKL